MGVYPLKIISISSFTQRKNIFQSRNNSEVSDKKNCKNDYFF